MVALTSALTVCLGLRDRTDQSVISSTIMLKVRGRVRGNETNDLRTDLNVHEQQYAQLLEKAHVSVKLVTLSRPVRRILRRGVTREKHE